MITDEVSICYRCLGKLPKFLGRKELRIGIPCVYKRLAHLFMLYFLSASLFDQDSSNSMVGV